MREVMGSILCRGKLCLLGFFFFLITFGGQFGGSSLGACRDEAKAGLLQGLYERESILHKLTEVHGRSEIF